MLIGYARVSTSDQSTNLQLDALTQAGCGRIFSDCVSGAAADRPALEDALETLRPGDTLITWKLDRLGRSLGQLIQLITWLEQRGIHFRSLSEAIDSATASGRLMFHVLGALAEFERSLIAERTRAGLAAAKSRGGILGRPSKLSDFQIKEAVKRLDENEQLSSVSASFGVSPMTVSRALRRS